MVAAICVTTAFAGPILPSGLSLNGRQCEPTVGSAVVVETTRPLTFTWQLEHTSRDQSQTEARVLVRDHTKATTYDSGYLRTNELRHVLELPHLVLKNNTLYTWTVQWKDAQGVSSPPSHPVMFRTGAYL